jgi:hypothetical protein
MIVKGNDVVGWTAMYPDDKSAVWASKRENAIEGCDSRRRAERFRMGKSRR